MEKTSYQELIDSRKKYDRMLTKLAIKNKKNRWVEAYRLVTELENARLNNQQEAIDGKLMGRMRFALTDLSNLNLILDQFADDDSKEFKDKFEEVLGGSFDQTEEINKSSIARDTQFELLMCARFRDVGLVSYLGDIHPDVVVEINGKKYGFECKRIFNFNDHSVQNNIEKAIDQLYTNFVQKNMTNVGLPLICIDRYITGGDKILTAQNAESTRSELGNQIQQFVDRHYKRWNGKKVKHARIIGVLLYMNVTAILRDEAMPVVCQQFGASNNGWVGISRTRFNIFTKEIAKLLGTIDNSKVSS
jgi:hypothetical protein